MRFKDSPAFLKWAKDYIISRAKQIPQTISESPYKRRLDLQYAKKLRALTKNFVHTYPLHTITNERRERKRFFRAFYQKKAYNPDFHYKKRGHLNPDKAYQAIQGLEKFSRSIPVDTLEGQAYKPRIFDAQKAIILISLSQQEGFSWISKEYYNFPKTLRATIPRKISFPHDQKEYIGAYEIVYLAQKILSQIGLKQKARLSPPRKRYRGMATTSRSIRIGIGTLRSPARIVRSLAHEILGHALCATNAQAYPAYFARRNSITTLLKEEGLAVKIGELTYQQIKNLLPRNLQSSREDYIPQLRIQAIRIAARRSFYNTYLKLKKHNVNDELAWELTTRVKRGVKDPALPGANYHDCLYYLGLKRLNTFLGRKQVTGLGILPWLDKLAQGKFNLEEFSHLPKIFPEHKHISLEGAFTIFIKEFQHIIKTKILKNL